MHATSLCRAHLNRLRQRGEVLADQPLREVTGAGSLSHGYWRVPVPEHLRHLVDGATYAAEHRLVMAQLLGRPLLPDETVHHRNGDRLDNRTGNLELWSCMQAAGQRVQDKLAFALEIVSRYAPKRHAYPGRNVPRTAFSQPTTRVPPSGFEPPLPP